MSIQENGSNCLNRMACMCSERVFCFFAVLFVFALGLILGAVFAPIILSALAAVIVFAIVMAVIAIALLIFRRCENCRNRDD